jgi:phosphoglycerate-specific signal transduction histidine kinase
MEEFSHSNPRLDRIEEKIDRLSEAMVSLARAEERIMAMELDRKEERQRMNKISDKIDMLDDKTNESARTIGIIHKMFWISFAAILTYSITILQAGQ